MAEFKLTYESQLDVCHPSYRWEAKDPNEDWKQAALRGPALPILGNAVAGAVGSAISNVVVYPLNVIVARLQTQQKKEKSKEGSGADEEEYTNIIDAAYKIYGKQGIAGFYPGLAQDTCKSVADSFLFFLAYTIVRQRRIVSRVGAARAAKSKNIVLPIWDELAIGVIAGSFSKLFTTPLSNIVTRKQTSASKTGPGSKDLSTTDIAAQIRKEKGISGFWSGYSAALILTLNPSITLFLNEILKYAVLPRAKRDKPSPLITFLLAATSKAAASAMTFKIHAKGPPNRRRNLQERRHIRTVCRSPREVLKGFFSHGFTMLAKDAVYASIVKMYYLMLILSRRYPSPDELIQRAREQAEEYGEIAREGARDLAESVREKAGEALENYTGAAAVDMTSDAAAAAKGFNQSHGIYGPRDLSVGDEVNETAELVGDYVEDEAAEWRRFYHWFWEKPKEE
ncbi:Mitochondrial substrate/solute carrier [Penicillium chermesinum]|uniref:Mitochondrial substrate/solute carrier n=1 Tax=Penicillium chermesinum TaxID=63820 RepID=A0A9W9NT26_9EURO|nr:Mitochondrial substrate/solute carrier [Penicillium chermesinum]KAJ5225672.1 Mitochondrial substrate/solute carrier [Penicillium chermesinum]